MVYHPDRLRYPLKRAGEWGEGKWQRIPWEEALGGNAARMQELAQRYNSTATAWVAPNAAYFDVLVEVRKVQEEE